ncbi:MAG: Kae1-associated kinase Bud32 [Candidatus Thorarchaeota archaeon]|nr:MAG: Kae1-associated kinase Bud32 [Candidatus Thorarchaeota archaeon]
MEAPPLNEVRVKEVLALGAESTIYRVQYWGHNFVLKHREPKTYLHPEIDRSLRRFRTYRECKMLSHARTLGIHTPTVYAVDTEDCTIMMEYIDGAQLKKVVGSLAEEELTGVCREFGRSIAQLHHGGVVHGDPTTSNILVDKVGTLWFVDFGLSEMNATLELKGVDLHLIRRALETTHWNLQDIMLRATLDGYVQQYGPEAKEIIKRMDEIRERGRYH